MRLQWSDLALADRRHILEYIAENSPLFAVRIDDQIESQARQLLTSPSIGRPGRIAGTRELMIRGTPYLAVYRIAESEIRVLRVLHGAQHWP